MRSLPLLTAQWFKETDDIEYFMIKQEKKEKRAKTPNGLKRHVGVTG